MDHTNGPRAVPTAEELQSHVKVAWKALASSMVARRAYRRYHGTFRYQYRFENWLTVILLVLFWGIYSIKIGEVSESFLDIYTATTAGSIPATRSLKPVVNDAGVVVTFVWAYTSSTDRWAALGAAIAYLLIAYAIIRYQRSLQLQLSAWLTLVASAVMLVLAIDAAMRSENSRKNLLTRSTLIWVWVVLQSLLLGAGLFRKKMLPWVNQSGACLPLALDGHTLYLGAYDGLSSIWSRFPRLQEHLVQDYAASGKPLFSFTGTYYNGMEGWLRWIGIRRLYSAQYVGGLNASGAPHGIGVWMDSYCHGEFLVGHFLNGMPVAPFRARTTKGSGFIAHRLGVLTCRSDSPGSTGSFTAAVSGRAGAGAGARRGTGWRPLHVGVASVECCTSGLFYKGFPRVLWLQRPTPVQAAEDGAPPPAQRPHGGPMAEATERPAAPDPSHSRATSASDEATPLIHLTAGDAEAAGASRPPRREGASEESTANVDPFPDVVVNMDAHAAAESSGAIADVETPPALPHMSAGPPASTMEGGGGAAAADSGAAGAFVPPLPAPLLSEAPGLPHLLSGLAGFLGREPPPLSPSVASSLTLRYGAAPTSAADSSSGLPVGPLRDASESASKGTQSLSIADMNEGGCGGVGEGISRAALPDDLSTRDFVTAGSESGMHGTASPADSILDQVALAAQRMPSMLSKPSHTGLTDVEDRIRSGAGAGGWASGAQSSWLTDSSAAAAPHASASTPGHSGSESASEGPARGCTGGSRAGSEAEALGCWPCRSPRLRLRRLWEPLPEDGLAGVTRLSPWLFSTASSSVMPDVGAFAVPPCDGGYEAILFVHGFNCSIEGALRLLGQLVALGGFPGHIMPVVFGWPCTVSVFYPQSLKVTASGYVAQHFEDALEHLRADGCHSVHLIGHSMGARVLAAAAQRLVDLFPAAPAATEPRRSAAAPRYGPGALRLATVTLLSPDLELGDFVGRCGPMLRSICDVVTVYGDSNDDALGWAAHMNSWLYRFRPEEAPEGLKATCDKMGIPLGTSLGKHCNTVLKLNNEPLDVDVVVTSFLESNIHSLRHNYFHLNREMVNDVRDVIVSGTRAAARNYRLEPSGPLVYGFMIAPSYVVAP